MKCKYVLVSEIGTNNTYYMPLEEYLEIMQNQSIKEVDYDDVETYEFTDEELLIAEKKLKESDK